MRYIDEFRSSQVAERIAHEIKKFSSRKVKLMEVCGTHTVSIFKHGIRQMLPANIELVSGPGCPVCVTSINDIDKAIAMAGEKEVILTTFGDMMRVPGSQGSLQEAKSEGSDIRVVYSAMDALKLAENHKEKKVIFFATGFETTSPTIAATIKKSITEGIPNYSVFSVHKLVPPALKALLDTPDLQVDGFICPGHVSVIIGAQPYEFIAERYHKPAVVAGFEPVDILQTVLMIMRQLEQNRAAVEIEYSRVVTMAGNQKALRLLSEVFVPVDACWRGIGNIPGSGLKIREEYAAVDAGKLFGITVTSAEEPKGCACGQVLRGIIRPDECKLFARACTPEKPVGACMVSSEGSCAAYYKYGR